MLKFLVIFAAICAISAPLSPVWAASESALNLRSQNGLCDFMPPESFLSGNFVADEVEPQFVFGKVKDFWKSRACPTNWLIEDSERDRLKNRENPSGPVEYTLYLEEDCPGKVVHYIFIDRSQFKSDQWMEWRKVFHKNKAEGLYGPAGVTLEQAARNGFPVDAELRFIEIGGDLILKRPEDFLTGDLKVKPIYDLGQGKTVVK
ncbi:MAG: hypothetical protein ABSH41_05040 [Syntrophobacteraceae bacterium]|jgi:hypothetical protein